MVIPFFLPSEGNILIVERNEVQQKLYMAVEVFILEVDELSLNKRLKTLQVGILKDIKYTLKYVYHLRGEISICL